MDESRMGKLREDNEIAFLRADVCISSPESFSIEEKTRICEEMSSSNKAIEDAMRADFESHEPKHRAALLDMLCESGQMTPEWWCELLLGKTPEALDDVPDL